MTQYQMGSMRRDRSRLTRKEKGGIDGWGNMAGSRVVRKGRPKVGRETHKGHHHLS